MIKVYINMEENTVKLIEKLLTKEMVRTNTPGMAVLVIEKNKISYSKGFGARNLSERLPVNENTIFNIASVSKSFVCLAILILHERKQLDIEDKISKYLPFDLGFDDDPIRIKHLMSHSSGLPSLDDNLFSRENMNDMNIDNSIPLIPYTSWDDYFRHINGASEYISERPGNKFYYNNSAFTLLDRIIEKVSEKTMIEFVKENILTPLEMNSSSFKLFDDENLSIPYMPLGKPTAISYTDNNFVRAAGGMYSTVIDMSRYMMMYMNRGKSASHQIISEKSIDMMFAYHFVEKYPDNEFTNFYGDYGKTGYGFGFVIQDNFYGHKLVHHSGSYFGSSAWFAFLPEFGTGVVILCNNHPSPRMYALLILSAILGKNPLTDFNLLSFRDKLNKLTGKYVSYSGDIITINIKNNMLFVKVGNDEIFLIPTEDASIYYSITEIGAKQYFIFEITEDIWLHMERHKFKKVN